LDIDLIKVLVLRFAMLNTVVGLVFIEFICFNASVIVTVVEVMVDVVIEEINVVAMTSVVLANIVVEVIVVVVTKNESLTHSKPF
jgi:hypothetical protein